MLRPGRGQPTGGGGYGQPAPGYGSPAPGGYGSPSPGYGTPGYGGGTNGSGYGGASGGYGGGSTSGAYGGYTGGGSHSSSGAAYGGYTGSGEFKDHKPRHRNKGGPLPPWLVEKLQEPWVWATIIAVFFFFLVASYRSQQALLLRELDVKNFDEVITLVQELQSKNKNYEKEVFGGKRKEDGLQKRYDSLVKENRQVQKERDELRVKYESPEKRSEEIRLASREDAWKKQVQLLQQATSRESRRAATEKFGPGPHRVQMNVLLPNEHAERSFVIEMAPLESMPHAVHLFLEHVDHGLWNNAWFYLNGPHVLQAGPQAEEDQLEEGDHEDERSLALKPFKELQLDQLVFPEYSEDYPHVPWTLGFTGRPGGPDWYINKSDNTAQHGPGGQYQHDLEEFADPCFAKVVEGLETLEAIYKLPTFPEDSEFSFFLEDAVHLVGTKLLTPKPDANTVPAVGASTEEHQKQHSERNEQSPNHEKRPQFVRPDIDHMVEP